MRAQLLVIAISLGLLLGISISILVTVKQPPVDIKIYRDQILECGKQHPHDLDEWKKCVDALKIR